MVLDWEMLVRVFNVCVPEWQVKPVPAALKGFCTFFHLQERFRPIL